MSEPGSSSKEPSSLVRDFMTCLQEAEQTSNTARLISLFADDAHLLNLTRHNTSSKQNNHSTSAQKFWSAYLNAFERIESFFTHTVDDGHTAVLEWHSVGSLSAGLPIQYNGVSVLEYEGDKIKTFRTYYDSAALFPHNSHSVKTYSETVGVPSITNEVTS